MKPDHQTATAGRLLRFLAMGFCAGAVLATAISKLRERNSVEDPRPEPVHGLSAGQVESSDQEGNATGRDLLNELRSDLGDRPSRQMSAALWGQVEKMSFAELRRLLQTAIEDAPGDWISKEVLAAVLERMMELDSKAVAGVISRFSASQIGTLLPNIAAVDPAMAVEIYDSLSEQERASFSPDDFLRVLAGEDIVAAKELAAGLRNEDRLRGYGILASALSESDPAAALAFLESLSDTDLAGGMSNREALKPNCLS